MSRGEREQKESVGVHGRGGRDDEEHGPDREAHGGGDEGEQQPEKRTTAEWVTLAISSIIVLAVVGLILYHEFTSGDQPAMIDVQPRLEEVRQEGGRYYLPVTVRNQGDEAVEDLRVELSLEAGEGEPETSEFSIMFLNAGAKSDAVTIFEGDPAQGVLSVSSLSYLEP